MAHGDVKSIVDSPWTSVGTSDIAREYLVLLTYLPLKGYRKMLGPHMGDAAFFRWSVKGDALPLHWDDALRRMSSSPA